MIITLEELCYRVLDLPRHREFYTVVMHQVKLEKVHKELINIFDNAGIIMQNGLGYLNYKFRITKHLYIGRKVINLVYKYMNVLTDDDAILVRKIMVDYIQQDII